jgi:hypothetical protein
MATDMFTLSKLHSTNATNSANTMPHRFFCPPSDISKISSSGGSFGFTSIAPPPARRAASRSRRCPNRAVDRVVPVVTARVAPPRARPRAFDATTRTAPPARRVASRVTHRRVAVVRAAADVDADAAGIAIIVLVRAPSSVARASCASARRRACARSTARPCACVRACARARVRSRSRRSRADRSPPARGASRARGV